MAERTALTTYRNSDLRITYSFPEGYNLFGFEPIFYFRVSPGETPLLTVQQIATVNGSTTAVTGDTVVLTLKSADLAVFGAADIYNGVYDSNLPKNGFVNKFVGGPHTQFIDGSYGENIYSDNVFVDINGREVGVILEAGNMGALASLSLQELNQAVVDAQAAETAAEAAAVTAVNATINKADLNGSNILGANQAAFRTAIGAVGTAALAAITGAALVGSQTPETGTAPQTLAQIILAKSRSIEQFGASTAASPAVNATAIQAAAYSGRAEIYVPQGTFETGAFALGDNVRLYGCGPASVLKFMTAADTDFISIVDAVNCEVDHLTIDINRSGRTGGFGATQGSGVRVVNTALTSFPRFNNARIHDCRIINPAFVGIYLSNAHGVWIERNYLPGDRDSAIAACVGSSRLYITGNYCAGYTYGISCSSDGVSNPNLAAVGYVRLWTVTNNKIENSKAGGYGIQLDGVESYIVSHNLIRMLGGTYGVRCYNSRGLGTAGEVDCHKGHINDNHVEVVTNIASAAYSFEGIGDLTDCLFRDNTASSDTATANGVLGLSVSGGVSLKWGAFSFKNLGYSVAIDPNNVAGSVEIADGTIRGANVSMLVDSAYANKTALTVRNVDMTGGSVANISANTTFNLILTNTPLVGTNYVTPNSLITNGYRNGSATYDPASMVDGAGLTTTITVSGAVLGDFAEAAFSLDLQGILVTSWISAANTLSVRFQNETGGTIDLASSTLRGRAAA